MLVFGNVVLINSYSNNADKKIPTMNKFEF